MPYDTIPQHHHNTIERNAMLYNAALKQPCNTIQYNTNNTTQIHYDKISHTTLHYTTLRYTTAQYNTIPVCHPSSSSSSTSSSSSSSSAGCVHCSLLPMLHTSSLLGASDSSCFGFKNGTFVCPLCCFACQAPVP
jgi:hypothetical protein